MAFKFAVLSLAFVAAAAAASTGSDDGKVLSEISAHAAVTTRMSRSSAVPTSFKVVSDFNPDADGQTWDEVEKIEAAAQKKEAPRAIATKKAAEEAAAGKSEQSQRAAAAKKNAEESDDQGGDAGGKVGEGGGEGGKGGPVNNSDGDSNDEEQSDEDTEGENEAPELPVCETCLKCMSDTFGAHAERQQEICPDINLTSTKDGERCISSLDQNCPPLRECIPDDIGVEDLVKVVESTPYLCRDWAPPVLMQTRSEGKVGDDHKQEVNLSEQAAILYRTDADWAARSLDATATEKCT